MTNSAATIALPTVAVARAATDPTMCAGAEWNDHVLVRRLADAVEMGAIDQGLADFVREHVDAMPLGAERDRKVLDSIGNIVNLIIIHEDAVGA